MDVVWLCPCTGALQVSLCFPLPPELFCSALCCRKSSRGVLSPSAFIFQDSEISCFRVTCSLAALGWSFTWFLAQQQDTKEPACSSLPLSGVPRGLGDLAGHPMLCNLGVYLQHLFFLAARVWRLLKCKQGQAAQILCCTNALQHCMQVRTVGTVLGVIPSFCCLLCKR